MEILIQNRGLSWHPSVSSKVQHSVEGHWLMSAKEKGARESKARRTKKYQFRNFKRILS